MSFIRRGYPWILLALVILAGISGWWKSTRGESVGMESLPVHQTAKQPDRAEGSEFDRWRAQITAGGDGTVVQRGVELAKMRRTEISALMKKNPAAALGQMLSYTELAALPEAVRAECERPWSGTGSIDLRWETAVRKDEGNHCRHHNLAFVGDGSWKVYGPDFVEAHPPRTNLPMTGYEIGGELLLQPSGIHQVPDEELAAAKGFFAIGNPSLVDPLTGGKADPEIAAVVGGKLYFFEAVSSIDSIGSRLAAAAAQAEGSKTAKVEHGLEFLASPAPTTPAGGAPVEETPYLGNAVNVLFIRVDFSDLPGEPVSKAALESTLSNVHTHISGYSYNQASISYTVTPAVYRMPSTGAAFAASGDNDTLIAAAKTLAQTQGGYNLANYSVVAVFFPTLTDLPGSKITYGGLASVGGGNHWINGYNDVDVITHEFGHNFGLYHANYWDPDHDFYVSDDDYNDPAGFSYEYGDIFDTMGSGDAANGYFSPFATRRLEWLPANKVVEPTANGTWRIHRFDDPGALSNQNLALRVPMGGDRYYWVGLRKRFGSPSNLLNAAYVVGEGLYVNRPNLIDMTPNSSVSAVGDRRDAGLPVGGTFYDSAAGVKFETLASGGTAPNEWIDVRITFDSRISIVDTAPEVDEKSGTAIVTVRRSFGSAAAASVNYATANGTATAGADYYASSGTLTWAAGDSSDKSVRIAIRPDTLNEGRETFTFQLSGATGATINAQAGTATIALLDAGRPFIRFAPEFFNSVVATVAPLADGKVLIGGTIAHTSGAFQSIRNLARLNPDGSVDTTFLTGSGFNGQVEKIVVQPDGRILVGGQFSTYNGSPANRLVRLNADGTRDAAFTTAMGTGPSGGTLIRAIALEASGSILVGGDFDTFSGSATEGMVRLTSAGARDAGNPLALPFATSFNSSVFVILVQDDGKIMAAGSFYIGSTPTGFRPGIARLNANGTRDTSFDPDGGPHNSGVNNIGYVTCMARQSDGKYVIGGGFLNYDGTPSRNLARIQTNGAFDPTFSVPVLDNAPAGVLVQSSGAVVVGGYFTTPKTGLVRLTSSGGVDASFMSGTGPMNPVFTAAESPDGGLYLGGNFFAYDGASSRPIIKVAGGMSPYATWVNSRFTVAQIAAGVTDPEDDPDNDGLKNGVEFGLGTNPVSTAGALYAAGTPAMVANGGDRYLQVSMDRSAAVTGIWCVAQFSNDLVTWTPAAPLPGSNATYDVIEDGGSRFTVRDKTASGAASKRFGRILFKIPE